MKLNKKELFTKLVSMDYSDEDAKIILKDLVNWYESIPNTIKLYRILLVDNKSDLNLEEIGSHFSTNKKELTTSHGYLTGVGNKKYLITVNAKKSQIDVEETLSNRILYPNENEVTLKNKGKGVEIVSIKHIKYSLDESYSNKSDALYNFYKKNGLEKSLEYTGFDFKELFLVIGDKIEIDSSLALEILTLMIKRNKFRMDKYKGYQVICPIDEKVIFWVWYNDGEKMITDATPFERGSEEIQIFNYTYSVEQTEERPYHYFNPGYKFSLETQIAPKNGEIFESFEELVNWYRNWYLPTVFDKMEYILHLNRHTYFEISGVRISK